MFTARTPISRISNEWVRIALSSESPFGDGPPRWHNMPSSAEADDERLVRTRLFRKFKAHRLARQLGRCAPKARCLSGACPACTRAAQRHFVSEAFPLLQPSTEFVTLSLVPNWPVALGDLSKLPITEFRDDLGEKLARSKIHFCVGGIDFTYNEHRHQKFAPHWSPHIWLLANHQNRRRWEVLLRRVFVRTAAIQRPVKIQEWDGRRGAIGYSLKYQFGRRISDVGIRSHSRRACKITTYDRLRSAERFELYSYLHQIGLGARILLIGVNMDSPPLLRLTDDESD